MNLYKPREKKHAPDKCPESPTGAHWWVMEGPNGQAQVQGVCSRCHVTRMFDAASDKPTTGFVMRADQEHPKSRK